MDLFGKYQIVVLFFRIIQVTSTNITQHFTFFNSAQTWIEAKVICESRGQSLLRIDTVQEKDYIIQLITSQLSIRILDFPLWIGLHRNNTSEQWLDGSRPSWSHYDAGFPTTTTGLACFAMIPENGLWAEQNCSLPFTFVCENDVGPCTFESRPSPTGCSGGNLVSPETLIQLEITEKECINMCLNSANADDVECWAVAYMPGCACPDCRLFYSKSTDYCLVNEGGFVGVSLFIKHCFEGDIQNYTEIGVTEEDIKTTTSIQEESRTTTTNNVPSITSEQTTNQCICPCEKIQTTAEIQKSIEEIIKKIKVHRKSTSLHKRTLISAEDKRMSSRLIGISGILIITIVLSIIVFSDVRNITASVKHLRKK